jgi:GH24 family phage-related lysozyme (muramidase)
MTIEISGGTPEDVVEGIPSNIDFDFISEQEGNRLDMYVPMSKGKALGISGPTIGTGVDIGQRSVEDLRGLPQDLIEKLSPYTQKTGQDAVRFVRDNPLKLSNDEIRVINSWAKKQETESLLRLWERDSDIPWDSLTKEQATAVSSVMYQYGSGRVRTPNFWRMATTGQWDKVEEELRNFGDKYSSRRNREADYLSRGRE